MPQYNIVLGSLLTLTTSMSLMACGGDRSTEVPEIVAGHCIYTSKFTDLQECSEYLGKAWTSSSMETTCNDSNGTLSIGEPCDKNNTLGACILDGGTQEVQRVLVNSTDSKECNTNKRGCELFGGGAWVDGSVCGGKDIVDDEGYTGTIFTPPTLTCKEPLPGEPPGQSENGDVCTWNMISGATEEGRKFNDYASCEAVLTQRPYYPAPPNMARADVDDERLQDPAYVTELNWVKSQIESSGCICCHSSEITPQGPSNWYVEAPGNFMDTFYDSGLAVGANYIPSRELGAYPPEENNYFDRINSGIPSTDPARMVAFFENELAHRGLGKEDFEGIKYTAGPIGAQLEYEPGRCENGEGIGRDGLITWEGGAARYIYVLKAGSENPGVPPNLDKPEGTLWRIDVALDGQVLKSNQVQYGVVPEDKDGVSQSVPDSQDTPPEALQSGEDYYLYVLADIAVPLSRCIFTYSK